MKKYRSFMVAGIAFVISICCIITGIVLSRVEHRSEIESIDIQPTVAEKVIYVGYLTACDKLEGLVDEEYRYMMWNPTASMDEIVDYILDDQIDKYFVYDSVSISYERINDEVTLMCGVIVRDDEPLIGFEVDFYTFDAQ